MWIFTERRKFAKSDMQKLRDRRVRICFLTEWIILGLVGCLLALFLTSSNRCVVEFNDCACFSFPSVEAIRASLSCSMFIIRLHTQRGNITAKKIGTWASGDTRKPSAGSRRRTKEAHRQLQQFKQLQR